MQKLIFTSSSLEQNEILQTAKKSIHEGCGHTQTWIKKEKKSSVTIQRKFQLQQCQIRSFQLMKV